MNKAIIDCVKDWLNTCDYLKDYEIRTDYLMPDSNNKQSFSLEQEQTTNSLVKGNVLGTKLKGSLNFTLASRRIFNIVEDSTNNDNLLLLQQIENWIVKQNLTQNYPELNENEEVTEISITSSPFLFGFDKSMTQSRYQMQFNVKYERRV